jgi:hypothetical protein
MNTYQETYRKFHEKLSPETVKKTLTLSALYLAAYEFLRRTIIDCVEYVNLLDFDITGYFFGGRLTPERRKEYEELTGIRIKGDEEDLEKTVRAKFKYDYKERYEDYLKAFQDSEDRVHLDKQMGMSCLWLVDNKVIDGDEIEAIERITKHRNDIAHELPYFLISLDLDVNLDYLNRIADLFSKIDGWQSELTRSIEPDPKIREQKWYSGRSLLLSQILSAALAD